MATTPQTMTPASMATVAAAVRVTIWFDSGRPCRTHHHTADQQARAAESQATLPLGLCFLPAFVLLSIVPTITDALIPYLPHP